MSIEKDGKHCIKEQGKSTIAGSPSVIGLNDNLVFMGKQLHVQTEHIEMPVARVVTQVFCSGRVVFSKKTEYPAELRNSHDFKEIQHLMNTQHFRIMQEIAAKQARILGSH